jgi:hypothetical protein
MSCASMCNICNHYYTLLHCAVSSSIAYCLLLTLIWQPGLPNTWASLTLVYKIYHGFCQFLVILPLDPITLNCTFFYNHPASHINFPRSSQLYQGSSSTMVYIRAYSPFTNILFSVYSILLYCFSLPPFYHSVIIYQFYVNRNSRSFLHCDLVYLFVQATDSRR